jgi:hypothetical protein
VIACQICMAPGHEAIKLPSGRLVCPLKIDKDKPSLKAQLLETFKAYLAWQKGDGDLDTFLDWVRDELRPSSKPPTPGPSKPYPLVKRLCIPCSGKYPAQEHKSVGIYIGTCDDCGTAIGQAPGVPYAVINGLL